MNPARQIVNNLLEDVDADAPEQYVDWLGQKADTGPLEKIRFGAHIHLSDEQMIRENAAEQGVDVDSPAFWDEIERCMAIMESHCLQILRESGLHVSDEGHDGDGARVASVWITTEEEDRKLALAKAVVNWAEGDWPSTTSGTMDYAFGADTQQRIYAMTEDAARFIDVTIEFTGTDAVAEWLKLNLTEAAIDPEDPVQDPDDPEHFVRTYMPRMLGRLLIEFNVIKPHFPDAPTNWYREKADGLDLFRYNRASEMKEVLRQMKAYNRQRGERAGIDQVTYRYKVPNPQGSSIVRQWLDKIECPPTVIQWACETNAPIWFWVSVKEFNDYMQMVYPQVKLDPVVEGIDDPSPDLVNQIKPKVVCPRCGAEAELGYGEDKLDTHPTALIHHDSEVPIERYLHPSDQGIHHFDIKQIYKCRCGERFEGTQPSYTVENSADPDDPEAFVKNYEKLYYKLFNGIDREQGSFIGGYDSISDACHAARQFGLHKRKPFVWAEEERIPNSPDPNVIVGSEPTGVVYDITPDYQTVRRVSESSDVDVDAAADPRAYLDAVTGWIDTFVSAGMTRYDTETHKDQLWKQYEVPGFTYWIYVHVREPKWIIVERNDILYGRNIFRRVFEFPDRDIKGMVNAFNVLDRKFTKARTRATDDWAAVDAEIDDLYQQHKKRRDRWLSGRIKEALDDPEMQRYLDQVSPEACQHCNNDLTQRHTVVRQYVERGTERIYELSGHYDPTDGYYTNDEKISANLLNALPQCDLPDDCDICQRCGKSTARAGSVRNESAELDNPEQYYRDKVYTLDELRTALENYGLSFPSNGIRPWGRWAIIDGFTYWAVYSKDPEKYLPQSYFREQLEKFCKDMGFTQQHMQLFGEYPEGITFKLAVPKTQIDAEAYGANERRLDDPDFREEREARDTVERDWLPEGAPDDPDAPESNIERHTADLDINAVMAKLGFTDGRTLGANWDCWIKRVGNKEWRVWPTTTTYVYGVTRMQRPAKFVQVGRGRRYGQWSEKGHFTCHVTELEQQLREEGALNPPPVGEALDPDDPSANLKRHLAAVDIGKIMADLGFMERWPTWKCADPEYMWYEKFVADTKWTVIRKSDDEPQMFTATVYKPRPSPTAPLTDWEEIARGTYHVGELEAKLRSALPQKVGEALGVPDPDAPEPNIERYAQHVEKTEADALDSAIANAIREFEIIVDKRGIDNARAADNLVGDLASKWAETAGYENGSDEFDWLMSALNNRAGEMFPGNWEDYPVQEAASKEAVDYPAVYVGGKIYIGPSHYHIMSQLEANDVDVSDAHHGWWTSRNRFLDTDLDVNELMRLSKKFAQRTGEEPGLKGEELPKAKQMTGVREVHEATDPDDPETFIQNMETDWRKILRQHGFKPQPHSDHLSYVLTYPDRVWGANWPVQVYAHHGWNPEPEFEYDHPDPDNPDIDAEDAAYDEWQRTHDEFAAIRQRDVAFPDLIALQFGREGWRRIEVPAHQLDAFLTRFTAGAKQVVGTETIASVHAGRGLTEMIWQVAQNAARELKISVKESLDVPDPMAYATDTFNVPDMLKRMGYERSTREEVPFEWHKVFHRMPTELDIMVEVKRRGLGGESNEGDIVYDITLYRYPVNDNPNKQWVPLVYRYGRNNLQLERVLKKLEERIKANDLRGIREPEIDEAVPIPPEDEPESVLPTVEKSLVRAELKRLDFGPKPERGIEWIYQEEMPRFWYNKYDGADGKPHGLYINFVSGQTPEIQTRNYNPEAKAWFVKGKEPPLTAPAESPAHLAAIVRDLDTTMRRCAAESLPPEQEHEALKRVIDHHRKWWEDTLDYLIAHDNRLPGRVGPGRPA